MPTCIKHRMPDGRIMDGPVHGAGQVCIEWSDNGMKKGGRTKPKPGKKQSGGYLVGPSHEAGGIPAIVGGTTPIELEGTEYIINGKATAALGTQFLDKLNATANDYHPNIQGFQQGELPQPSQYEIGGKLNYQAKSGKKMKRGGNIPLGRKKLPIQRKLQEGGQVTCPPGMFMKDGACFQITGNPNVTNQGYMRKRGGTLPKKQTGGMVNQSNSKKPGMRAIRKLRNNRISKRKVGTNLRKTSIDNHHSHIMYVDEHNDGWTNAGPDGHKHQIKNGQVMIDCTGGSCHTHN